MTKTRSTRSRQRAFLDVIRTHIAGRQYFEAALVTGEPLRVQREPDNQHDPNAFRIENRQFVAVGYLPAPVAAWLAPLVDRGQIEVEAVCREGEPAPHGAGQALVELAIWLRPAGSGLVEPRPIGNSADVVHNLVLRAYHDAKANLSAEAAADLAKTIGPLAQQDLLPETKMLVAMLAGAALARREAEGGAAVAIVASALAEVEIAPPLHFGAVAIYPLVTKTPREPVCVLLSRAIELGTATVEEVSEAGSVPKLKLTNRGLRPILVPEGEILVGAKQNRVVNLTRMIAPKSTTTLPVSCVERSRWRYQSQDFRSAYQAPPSLRSKKVRSSLAAQAEGGNGESDQDEVWTEVSECLADLHASSATESITDGLDQARLASQALVAAALPADTVAVVVSIAGQRLVVDWFDCPSNFAALWPRFAQAYALDALRCNGQRASATQESVVQFLKAIPCHTQVRAADVGIELEVMASGLVGTGVIFSNQLCHLAAFATKRN